MATQFPFWILFVMILRDGGLDIFYVDESHDSTLYAVTALAIPFLRKTASAWNIVWPDHLQAAQIWRRRIAKELHIPLNKELHATKLISGRGNFFYGNRQFIKSEAVIAYQTILEWINFIPDASIITVVGQRGQKMYGHDRLERSMYALFQRMRGQCASRNVNAMTFFDQGHPEYRRLYRRARVNLPTGSIFGGTRNVPLDMFVKDANEKIQATVCLPRRPTLSPMLRSRRFAMSMAYWPTTNNTSTFTSFMEQFPSMC